MGTAATEPLLVCREVTKQFGALTAVTLLIVAAFWWGLR